MKYFDKNGTEIHAGMFLRMEDGSVEEVYTCGDGYDGVDLGINASNEEYMRRHQLDEYYREYYSLSNFDLTKAEICEPELDQTEQGLNMYPL